MTKPFDVFLSYTRGDEEFARKLAADLKTEGFEPWLDVTNLKLGDQWESKIRDAIAEAEFLLILLSVDSVKSEWLTREAQLAASRGKGRVIPIIIDEMAKSAIPGYLNQIQWLDMSTPILYTKGLQKLSGLVPSVSVTKRETKRAQDIKLESIATGSNAVTGRNVTINYATRMADIIDVDDFATKVAEKLRHQVPSPNIDINGCNKESTNFLSNLVFVIMSFEEDMDPIFEGVRAAANAAGLEAKRVKDVIGDYRIDSKLIDMIREACMVVVDLTHERPNVYFELGYARGIGKAVITIARRGTSLHFDVQSWTCDFYIDSRTLERQLTKRFRLEWSSLSATSPA